MNYETLKGENKMNARKPLKQFLMGIDPHEISCKDGFSLVFKNTNFHPACVKSSSVQKLIDRGFCKS